MRRRLERGLDPHRLSRDAFRALIAELTDEVAETAAAAADRHGGFVTDHSPLDSQAFWLYYGFGHDAGATDAFMERARRHLAHFDAVVILPWGAIPLADDGVRSPNIWIQRHFQAVLEGLAHRCKEGPRILWMPEGVTDPQARVDWVLGRI